MADQSGLIEAILQEGRQKEKEILSQAEEEAQELIRHAGEERSRKEEDAVEALEREMAMHLIRERHRLILESRRQAAKIQDEIAQDLFQWCGHRLGTLRLAQGYPEALQRMWIEALDGLEREKVQEADVRVHPDDQQTVQAWITGAPADRARVQKTQGAFKMTWDASWRLVPDPAISGGVELLLDQGRIRISNTLESRLSRGWHSWLPEIRQRLFG